MIKTSINLDDVDFGYDDILKNVEDISEIESVVGFFQEDIEDGIALSQLMAIHEFGSSEKGIPERPAMRSAFDSKERDLAKKMFEIGDKIIFENLDPETGMQVIGDNYKKEFQNGVITKSLNLASNKPQTVKRKGSDTPLVDTGRLVGGIKTKVQDK